jgi:hypothetical protein
MAEQVLALIAKVKDEIHESIFGRLNLTDKEIGDRIHFLGDLKQLLKRLK